MTTRDDIALSTMHFVPCLLPVLPLSWILRWSSVLSAQSSQSSKSLRGCRFPSSSFGGRCGSFQLKATIYCSKSRVINCTVREKVGYPATARGSGKSVGATTGGFMQRRQGVCVSISRYSGLCFRWTASLQVMALLALCAFVCGGISHAQGVNTATLAGTVVDS